MDKFLRVNLEIFNKLPTSWKFSILSGNDPLYLDDIEGFYPDVFNRRTLIELINFSELVAKNFAGPEETLHFCKLIGIPSLMIGFTENVAEVRGYWFSPECSRILLGKISTGRVITLASSSFVVLSHIPKDGGFAVTSTKYFPDLTHQEIDEALAAPAHP